MPLNCIMPSFNLSNEVCVLILQRDMGKIRNIMALELLNQEESTIFNFNGGVDASTSNKEPLLLSQCPAELHSLEPFTGTLCGSTEIDS